MKEESGLTEDAISCPPSRWQLLKAKLNNLEPLSFKNAIKRSENPVIIDVRTPEEFQEWHIPNAINISYLSEYFWEAIEKLDKNHTFFICCRSTRRSIRTCTLMRNGGFDPENIFNLEGGIHQWKMVFNEES